MTMSLTHVWPPEVTMWQIEPSLISDPSDSEVNLVEAPLFIKTIYCHDRLKIVMTTSTFPITVSLSFFTTRYTCPHTFYGLQRPYYFSRYLLRFKMNRTSTFENSSNAFKLKSSTKRTFHMLSHGRLRILWRCYFITDFFRIIKIPFLKWWSFKLK